jgi:phosphatidylglycerophosphatase C
MKKKLVLFDFDGTITTKDTLFEFIRFYVGNARFVSGLMLLSPVLTLYLLKLIPNWKTKEFFLRWFIGGETASIVEKRSLEFSKKVLPQIIRPKALAAIKKYQKEGATIAVVTASSDTWVKPWCDKLGILCLATKLEVVDDNITGRLVGKNCFGEEKACRIRQHFNLSKYAEIIAYGDSKGDREMFALAHKYFYKPFQNESEEIHINEKQHTNVLT